MLSSKPSPHPSGTFVGHVLIALLLGLSVGVGYFISANTQVRWAQAVLPVVVFVLAAAISGARTTGRIGGMKAALVMAVGAAIVVGVVELPALTGNVGPSAPQLWNTYSLLVLLLWVPLSVGAGAAFTVAGGGKRGLAVAAGLVAWLGVSMAVGLVALQVYLAYELQYPGGDGGIALPLTLIGLGIAFVPAALGGLLGALIRRLVQRSA